jgi:aryl-alcohol dehydrogenase-like predicted oxidoreductase
MCAVRGSGETTLEIERRPLAGSSLTLSRIALGCGNFGGVGSSPAFFGSGLTAGEAFELMDAAWDLGIRHFDTADAYGGGRSEEAIGGWMRARGRRPTLTSKTFNPMNEGADHGLAPERVTRQFESSLRRLGVEQVDLYLAHDFDPEVPLADTLETFDALARAGRIGAYGVSNFNADQLRAALHAGAPRAVQNSYSLLARDDRRDVIPMCADHDVAYIVFSPLAGGWLTGTYRRAAPFPDGSRMTQRPEPYLELMEGRVYDQLEALEELASGRGTSMAGLALAWLLDDPRVAQIAIGPGRPAHLEPVREALEAPLSDGERARLQELFP